MKQKTIDSEFAIIIDLIMSANQKGILSSFDIVQWCDENCIGDFNVFSNNKMFERIVMFENKEDLLLFILKGPFRYKLKD